MFSLGGGRSLSQPLLCAFSEALPQSEVLVGSDLDTGDGDLFESAGEYFRQCLPSVSSHASS